MTISSQNLITKNNLQLENTEILILSMFLKVVILGPSSNLEYEDILNTFQKVETKFFQNYYLGKLVAEYQKIAYKYKGGALSDYDISILKSELWDKILSIYKPFSAIEDVDDFKIRRANFGKEIWHSIERVSFTDYDTYASIVNKFISERSANHLQNVFEEVNEILKLNSNDNFEKVIKVKEDLDKFTDSMTAREDQQYSIVEAFNKYRDNLFAKINNSFNFGIKEVDAIINSDIPKECLVVLGGLSGHGKTAIALNMLYNHLFIKDTTKSIPKAINPKGFYIFYSCEMSLPQILERLFSIHLFKITNNPRILKNINKETLEQWKNRFEEDIQTLTNFLIVDNLNTIEDIEAHLIKKKKEGNIEMVMLDYFQFLHTKDLRQDSNDFLRIQSVSVKLLAIKKKIKTSMVVLAQLIIKKNEYKVDNMPGIGDIYYSSSIVQNADLVLNILTIFATNPKGVRLDNLPATVHFNICKNRSGKLSCGHFLYYGDCCSVL